MLSCFDFARATLSTNGARVCSVFSPLVLSPSTSSGQAPPRSGEVEGQGGAHHFDVDAAVGWAVPTLVLLCPLTLALSHKGEREPLFSEQRQKSAKSSPTPASDSA